MNVCEFLLMTFVLLFSVWREENCSVGYRNTRNKHSQKEVNSPLFYQIPVFYIQIAGKFDPSVEFITRSEDMDLAGLNYLTSESECRNFRIWTSLMLNMENTETAIAWILSYYFVATVPICDINN